MMSRIEIHPAFCALFAKLGLTTAEDFLRLEGEILGGHPDRHVLRLTLRGAEPSDDSPLSHAADSANVATAVVAANRAIATTASVGVYLKKEHRLLARDRLAHAWLGFGWVSKSAREGRVLREVERAGIDCPRPMAWGEADGRAFLLVREEPDVHDLRQYLQDHADERTAIAKSLARAVARIHEAGYFHRDLSSKHVLVGRDAKGHRFCFLDWQRARRTRRVGWRQRLMDLAMLDATLAAACASARERLLFWRDYLAAADPFSARSVERSMPAGHAAPRGRRRRLLRALCRLSARLQRKRRIRELRQAPLPGGKQNLIWLDGEAFCVTRQFLDEVGTPPAWLQSSGRHRTGNAVEVATIVGTNGRAWRLVRRSSHRPVHWFFNWWRRASFPAPEFEHAAAIIRLERYGIDVPRLLALGSRRTRPWRNESFLLVEPPANTVSLLAFLKGADRKDRRRLLREAGALWRRLHEAGYAWRGNTLAPLALARGTGKLVLTGVEFLERKAGIPDRLARRDLRRLLDAPLPQLSAMDRLRFALGYFGQKRATDEVGNLLRRLVNAARRKQRRRALLERRVI